MKVPTVGVAIPCFKGHIQYLNRLFDSIQSQTVLPNMVVVSCSSSYEDELNKEFDGSSYSFPFKIIIINEYRNPAQNRNESSRALDTDVISYFDADDIMHPQRIECIRQCFTQITHCKIMFHANSNKDETIKYNNFEYRIGILKKNDIWGCVQNIQNPYDRDIKENITIGHCSIKSSVFKEVKYNEDNSLRDRDDTLFCVEVLEKYPHENAYSPLILSKYIPSRTNII